MNSQGLAHSYTSAVFSASRRLRYVSRTMSADASMPPTLAAVYGYHTASTHRLAAYAPGPGYLDWATQPDPFRRFHAAPRVDLPLLADRLLTSFAVVRAGVAISALGVFGYCVACLLLLSLGLSACKQY